jgi:hypothetical protein
MMAELADIAMLADIAVLADLERESAMSAKTAKIAYRQRSRGVGGVEGQGAQGKVRGLAVRASAVHRGVWSERPEQNVSNGSRGGRPALLRSLTATNTSRCLGAPRPAVREAHNGR